MNHLIKCILGLLPFLLLCLMTMKGNLPKNKRGRQVFMPAAALIYCGAVGIFHEKLTGSLYDGIMLLVSELAEVLPVLDLVNWTYLFSILMNTLLALLFLALKGVLLPLSGFVLGRFNSLMENLSGFFYEYEEDLNQWLLKKKWGRLRDFFRYAYMFTVAISTLLLFFSYQLQHLPQFETPLYPVLAVLVLGEIFFYLSGMTKAEFVEDILGEDEESYKIANYGPLRSVLSGRFPENVLYENTADSTGGLTSNFDVLERLKADDDGSMQALGEFFSGLKAEGEGLDPNYIKGSVELLKGNSALFYNPFYRDLTNYVVFPLIRSLLKYKKCLVVIGRDAVADDVQDWLSESITRTAGSRVLWKVGLLNRKQSSKDEIDIGILRPWDLFQINLLESKKEFLEQVGFVILLEPSAILGTGQLGLALAAGKCGGGKKVTYCISDRSCDGLVDNLSHTLSVNIVNVFAPPAARGTCSRIYWDGEDTSMQSEVFPGISGYLGMGTELNATAMKYQISDTYWHSSGKFPVTDMKWIAGQYFKEICRYAEIPVSQEAFGKAFHVSGNLWGFPLVENAFITVEDEFHNLFEMGRIFASRAENQGFVNVISENYLLREYMVEHSDIFLKDPKAVPSIVPDFARSQRNTVLKILLLMMEGPVASEDVEKELRLAGIEKGDPYKNLADLLQRHCSIDERALKVSFKEELRKESLLGMTRKYFYIDDSGDAIRYMTVLKNAYYITEDEDGESRYIGAKLYGHVFQSILPGQYITAAGKYYEVQTITPESGVVVKRAADHINGRRYYRQMRRIVLSDWVCEKTMGSQRNISGMEITRGFCSVSVETAGYMELKRYSNLKEGKIVSIHDIPGRFYKNKAVLRINLSDADDLVKYTVCLLFNELFKTLYPENYHYISVIYPEGSPAETHVDAMAHIRDLEAEHQTGSGGRGPDRQRRAQSAVVFPAECLWDGDGCLYVVEDSEVDMGLLISVERNLTRFLEYAAEILSWHNGKTMELSDYEQNCYLTFGFDKVDERIDTKAAQDYLIEMGYGDGPLTKARKAGEEEAIEVFNPEKKNIHLCDFCAAELFGVEFERLHDGRERCSHCSASALRTAEEFKEIYKSVARNMETFFGIRINTAVKVRMANAQKIAKHTGQKFIPSPGFTGRVLGFSKKDKSGYTIFIENGSPKLSAIATIAHEMTHIWQFMNWNKRKMIKRYGKKGYHEVMEGMATWVEVQYLYYLNEVPYARRQELLTSKRTDEYGSGFRKFAVKYPLKQGDFSRRSLPFDEGPPL